MHLALGKGVEDRGLVCTDRVEYQRPDLGLGPEGSGVVVGLALALSRWLNVALPLVLERTASTADQA
jgi:hypothetical protein